jgi:hypothetical protein
MGSLRRRKCQQPPKNLLVLSKEIHGLLDAGEFFLIPTIVGTETVRFEVAFRTPPPPRCFVTQGAQWLR